MINTKLRLRCYGCRRDADAAWKSPLSEINPFYTMQFTMTINDTLKADPRQITGAKQDIDMSIPASYEMDLQYNNVPIPENRRCLFRIHWYAKNLLTGAVVSLGSSPNIFFIPKDKGFTFPYGFAVWANVTLYAGSSIVVQGGKKVIQDGRQVLSQRFE